MLVSSWLIRLEAASFLFLCMGIIMVDTSDESNDGAVHISEIAALGCSTLTFTLTVWVDGWFNRWTGRSMLIGFPAFIT
jgi:hypothetical protein